MLLYPFRLVVRPYLAPGAAAFFTAHTRRCWSWPCIIVTDRMSHSRKPRSRPRAGSRKVAAIRSGNFVVRAKTQRPPSSILLRPTGPQPVALFWKISLGSAPDSAASLDYSSRYPHLRLCCSAQCHRQSGCAAIDCHDPACSWSGLFCLVPNCFAMTCAKIFPR